jgi:hypothetical protein
MSRYNGAPHGRELCAGIGRPLVFVSNATPRRYWWCCPVCLWVGWPTMTPTVFATPLHHVPAVAE